MDIPLSILLLLCLIFLVIGGVLMLLLQYYVYFKITNLPEESAEQRDINAKYSLPMAIQQKARSIKAGTSLTQLSPTGMDSGPLLSLNFVMQFLFHELKNSTRVRKWFYRKLSLELDELITKTTTGRLFDKLTIKELELGDQFPEIKAMRLHNVELDDKEGRIENLDLILQLHYAGNFRTSIDADMVLGKKGSLTLKVKQLSGWARLQFTRHPYTHWSLSFLGDPELDLAVESKYQGRQMQPNITSLISNQIRKAVRRKHTLPNYKLRYKPFFNKTPEDEASDGDILPNGLLTVKVSELSRLMSPSHITDIYCTLTVASLAFVEARQRDDRNVIISLDVEIHKAKNQQIGIVFKQATEQCVEIEAILPNTPACKSNLRIGDVLLAIEGKRVATISQVAKAFKALNSTVFRLRIERFIPGIIRNDAILEDLELYEDLGDLRTGYGSLKPIETDLSLKQLIARHNAAEKGTSSESSLNNTPTSSPKKAKFITKALKKTMSRESSESTKEDESKFKLKLSSKIEEKLKTPTKFFGEGINDVEHYYQHSTIDCPLGRLITMEDLSNFKLEQHCRFLNVCVYGKCLGISQLLGFVNIPVSQILAECCETSLTQCWKTYELNPPIPQDLKSHNLSNQSGFNPNLCFGDILFAFTWDGNPNLAVMEVPAKGKEKVKISSQSEKCDDSGVSTADTLSIKSSIAADTVSLTSTNTIPPRAHNFIRTHFQRATQCDFCGKKIWLKDAVQCRDCLMCCHKKCVTKCQNATVCGPVDCSNALQDTPTIAAAHTPEFTVTEAAPFETSECEEALPNATEDEQQSQAISTPTSGLEVHRSSLTGLLAQGIKRVNSANNLVIPGIVSSFASGVSSNTGGNNASNSKSLPPSPSRKQSLVAVSENAFELVTRELESIPVENEDISAEQIHAITEPIINLSQNDDAMNLAKSAGQKLYADMPMAERNLKINILLSKLRFAWDSETAMHATLTTTGKNSANAADSTPQKGSPDRTSMIAKSEARIQALSSLMLYLCTGLQQVKDEPKEKSQ